MAKAQILSHIPPGPKIKSTQFITFSPVRKSEKPSQKANSAGAQGPKFSSSCSSCSPTEAIGSEGRAGGGGRDRNRRAAGERLAEESRRVRAQASRTGGNEERRSGLNETGLGEEQEGAERASGCPEMGGAPRRPRLLLLSAR